jgi:menaquinone-dependent protoporphyrinogen oxidase
MFWSPMAASTVQLLKLPKKAEKLNALGVSASVFPASHVNDVTPYDAVVLGSAVYAGHWMKETVHFLEIFEKDMTKRPVWFFSSGPTGEGDPIEKMRGWRFPEAQQAIADRIQPRDVTLFHGKIDLQTMNFGERLVVRALGAPVGDFRDWSAIDDWAAKLATGLQPVRQPQTVAARQTL